MRLLCLSYAGGGTVDFRAWAGDLLPALDLCPVILPGRETRIGEKPIGELPALIEAMLPVILPLLRLAPFAIYGHSMGSWVAFELVRALRRQRLPLPAHLFVAARRAPHRPTSLPPLSALPDGAFVDAMQARYGGIPDAVRKDRELMSLFLPALKADIGLLDRYRWLEEPPLAIPITALHGSLDRTVDPSDVEAWAEHTSAGFAFHTLPGGHFFLRDAREAVVDRINASLRPLVGRSPLG